MRNYIVFVLIKECKRYKRDIRNGKDLINRMIKL
jgi:hypothetical protein